MNSQERIVATIGGAPLDRRAFTPVLSLYGARLIDCPLTRYYSDPVLYAQGQAAVRDEFQPDALFTPFAFAAIGAAFGSEVRIFENQAPNIRRPAIQSVKEWDNLVLPDPEKDPHLLFIREATRRMVEQCQGQVPVAAVLPAPIDLPALVMGIEAWLETVLFDDEGVQRILEKTIPVFVSLANALLAEGAAFLALPCAFAAPSIVTREIAAKFARPTLERTLAQIKGPAVLHHAGGPILAHLDLLAGLPSTVAFAVDHTDDLRQARQKIGSDAVLFGGLCGPNLGRMTAAQVDSQCRSILEERRQDAHFVLGTSGADIPLNTPPENIHALRRAVETFARKVA